MTDDKPDNFDWGKLLDSDMPVDTRPSASVSFMITRLQRARLRELGYSDERISAMTPEEAHRITKG